LVGPASEHTPESSRSNSCATAHSNVRQRINSIQEIYFSGSYHTSLPHQRWEKNPERVLGEAGSQVINHDKLQFAIKILEWAREQKRSVYPTISPKPYEGYRVLCLSILLKVLQFKKYASLRSTLVDEGHLPITRTTPVARKTKRTHNAAPDPNKRTRFYNQAETAVITDPIATNHTAVEGPSLDDQMEEEVLADDQMEPDNLSVVRDDAIADGQIDYVRAIVNDCTESPCADKQVPTDGVHFNHTDALVDTQVDYLSFGSDVSRFKKCSVVSTHYLDRKVTSIFVMQTTNQVYHLRLAPLEVYSADSLEENVHGRDVFPISKMNHIPSNSVVIFIPGNIPEWMDPRDNLHVVRKESIIFRSHQDIIATDFGFLLQTVLKYGKHDPSRASHSNQSG
jgi:hypothetical protein